MDSTTTSRISPAASPSHRPDHEDITGTTTTTASRVQGTHSRSNMRHSPEEQSLRTEARSQPSQLQSHFESRGSLDTLVAAALKPLADNSNKTAPASISPPPASRSEQSPPYKPTTRSTMSISSLLGDSSSTPAFPRTSLDEPHSRPEYQAIRSAESFEHWRADGFVSDEEIRPLSRRDSRSGGSDSDSRVQDHQNERQSLRTRQEHLDHYPHKEQDTGCKEAEVVEQHHHRQHHHDRVHALDTIQHLHPHHHRHQHQHQHPAPIHQHAHGHIHQHHPPHEAYQHTLPPHHHHHHVHRHHLHQGRSSVSGPSAFSYMPKSLGLRLDPNLKVNATQVYISYLIQLDQMQRAQHLMRSSEKRKSIHDGVSESVQGCSGLLAPDRHHQHSRSCTLDCGEPSRSAQVVPRKGELTDRHEDGPISSSPEEQNGANPSYHESMELVVTGATSERASTQTPTLRQAHLHARSSHQHQHQHQPPPPYGHGHVHPHHAAPVLPAHIHPPQHHHHIVPVTAKPERGIAKANGARTVHRHHGVHHHHPHHHPYHPNHPNHQHHFHHHASHPTTVAGTLTAHSHSHNHNHHAHTHGHAHGHAHAHNHSAHVHHGHIHNHGHVRTHAHSHSPSSSSHREQSRRPSQSLEQQRQQLALPASQPLPSVAGYRLAKSGSPEFREHSQEHEQHLRQHHHGHDTEGQGQSSEPAHQHEPDEDRPLPLSPTPMSARTESAMLVD